MNLSDNWNNSGVTQRLNGDTDGKILLINFLNRP